MTINDLKNIDFDSIPINPYWNTSNQKENSMHRIHAYPAKFPSFITSKAIQYAEENKFEVKLVADIFCGCRTTAYEATKSGKDFWGSDINPVVTLIARTKSQTYQEKRLDRYFKKLLVEFTKQDVTKKESEFYSERIKYWFEDQQIIDLLKLRLAIVETIPKQSKYFRFFLTAFSNILKPTSKWLTKSIKPQIDPPKKHIA